ncbi:MAG: MFS transporter [Opitutus sp.]|nr:MFS transporter [Opitutus sp.]
MIDHDRVAPSSRRLWSSVVALAVAETVSWGVLYYAFGVLLPAIENDLAIGRTALTAVFSAALLVSAFVAAPVGRWLDRRGARPVMTIGAVVAPVLLLAWSRAGSLAEIAVVWLALGLTQALVLYEPAFVAVTDWFADVGERSRALLMITLMGGLASTIFLPLTGLLLAQHGWRTAVAVLAVIVAVVTIPVHATLPRSRLAVPRKNEIQGNPDDTNRGSAPGFTWLIAAFALHGLVAGAMAVHAVPLITEAGRSPVRAAAMVGLFGVFQVAGRLMSATWWERVPGGWRVGGLIAAQSVAMIALGFARLDAAVWVFVVSFGASNGMLTLARPLAVAEWRAGNFGAASGRVAAWSQGARAVSPLLASGLHAATGGYLSVTIALAGVGAAGVWAARRAFRQREEPRAILA